MWGVLSASPGGYSNEGEAGGGWWKGREGGEGGGGGGLLQVKEGGKHSQYLRVNTFGTKTVGPLATKSGVD